MENIPGNPSLGTQETQTCDSEWIIFQETHHKAHRKPKLVTLNGEYSRKPNLWIRGNCSSCITASIYFFVSFIFFTFNRNIKLFVLFLVRDLMNTEILIPPFGWFFSSVTVYVFIEMINICDVERNEPMSPIFAKFTIML